ncbi:MAG: PIN domain-containing protein [Eubacteriales bacterium]|nr:PIN domain-containing protein [Eubacteriales bacterium]
MVLLIDANILLDVLQNREPHVRNSSIIWKFCETGKVRGVVSTLTFANIVYILRKELTPDKVEQIYKTLSLIFDFVEFSPSDLSKAASMKWDDFEDAVQSALAEKIHANFIVTRNIRDFSNSKIMALTPTECIARM